MNGNGQKKETVRNGNISVLQSENKTDKIPCPMTYYPV